MLLRIHDSQECEGSPSNYPSLLFAGLRYMRCSGYFFMFLSNISDFFITSRSDSTTVSSLHITQKY